MMVPMKTKKSPRATERATMVTVRGEAIGIRMLQRLPSLLRSLGYVKGWSVTMEGDGGGRGEERKAAEIREDDTKQRWDASFGVAASGS